MLLIDTKRLKNWLFIGLCFCVCSASIPVKAQYFEFTDKRKRESIPFKLVKNLIIIPLKINNKGPYNFVLDTGVGLFIITDPTLTDTLQIQHLRSIKITGFGEGADLSAYVTPSIKVDLAHTSAVNLSAAIFKEDLFSLSAYAGMPIHGLIGYEFFSSFIVRINYSANVITIFRPDAPYILRKGSKIPITIENRKPYMVTEIDLGSGKKIRAKLIIDSGAGHPVSLERLNGLPFKIPPVNIDANLGIGLSGPISGYLARIQSICLGKYRLKNVIAAYPNYEDVAAKISVNRNGNLGNSILKRFNVIFDYKHKAMFLKPGILFKEPFEHNMSGIEITSAGEGFKRIIITRVEPYSPADDLGLKKDDEISSINFKPVSEMRMQEIDDLFRSKSDRSLILEILPKGQKKVERVVLTLQRRI